MCRFPLASITRASTDRFLRFQTPSAPNVDSSRRPRSSTPRCHRRRPPASSLRCHPTITLLGISLGQRFRFRKAPLTPDRPDVVWVPGEGVGVFPFGGRIPPCTQFVRPSSQFRPIDEIPDVSQPFVPLSLLIETAKLRTTTQITKDFPIHPPLNGDQLPLNRGSRPRQVQRPVKAPSVAAEVPVHLRPSTPTSYHQTGWVVVPSAGAKRRTALRSHSEPRRAGFVILSFKTGRGQN